MIDWEAGVSNLASCVFFFGQGVGFGAMASPSSVCLGCRSVCSSSRSFSLSFCSLFLSFFLGGVRIFVFVLMSALAVFLSCAFVLLPLAGAYVVGGFFGGWLCMLRCLCLLYCFALL